MEEKAAIGLSMSPDSNSPSTSLVSEPQTPDSRGLVMTQSGRTSLASSTVCSPKGSASSLWSSSSPGPSPASSSSRGIPKTSALMARSASRIVVIDPGTYRLPLPLSTHTDPASRPPPRHGVPGASDYHPPDAGQRSCHPPPPPRRRHQPVLLDERAGRSPPIPPLRGLQAAHPPTGASLPAVPVRTTWPRTR